jgi:hypothetical protein
MMASLVLLRRTDVMQRFSSSNFETGELVNEPDRAMHEWVLQQLHLEPHQVSSIAGAMDCFQRLLDPIMQERQQLQSEISQQQEQPGSGGCSSSGGGSSVDSYKRNMAKREASLLRLSSLMQKECLVRTAAAASIAGVLTYVQMATVAVMMTPNVLSLQMTGMLVQQQQHKQQQQQQQQQKQQ